MTYSPALILHIAGGMAGLASGMAALLSGLRATPFTPEIRATLQWRPVTAVDP